MRRHLRTWRMLPVAVFMVFALLAAACVEEDDEAAPDNGVTGEVSMLGAFTDEDGYFRDMLAEYEQESGITVEYEGSADFETVAVSRIEGGNPPDILLFPQPGLMGDFAQRDQILNLEEVEGIDRADIEDRAVAGLAELGLVDDTLYAIPITTNLKSLVWYPKGPFEDAGYEVPETWDELLDLTDQIREEQDVTPWCVGIESAGATGWPATDWIEDLLLRVAGPEAYDDWVAGELPFDSEEVRTSFEMFEELILTEGNTLGGRTGIVTTPFGAAPEPMFEDPPACYLHKQASFIVGSFPDDVEYGVDYDVFYFPPAPDIGDYDGAPTMGAGDIASLATDNEAAVEVLNFLTTPESFERSRAQEGGTLFAYEGFDPADYPNEVDTEQARILEESDVFRFDGSDLMPGAVGAGAFWTEITAWINGDQDLDPTLQGIDAAWP